MTIEAKLDRMIELLEKLTATPAAAPAADKPAAPKAATQPAKNKKSDISMDDVKVALQKLLASKAPNHGSAAVKEILAAFGVTKLGDLEEANYADARTRAMGVLDGTVNPDGTEATDNSDLL